MSEHKMSPLCVALNAATPDAYTGNRCAALALWAGFGAKAVLFPDGTIRVWINVHLDPGPGQAAEFHGPLVDWSVAADSNGWKPT